jgi:predicted Na+-dependent transporter
MDVTRSIVQGVLASSQVGSHCRKRARHIVVHLACFVPISQLSFSLIIVSNSAASSAAMSWCCLLAHGERRLVRVVSNFSGSWRASWAIISGGVGGKGALQ